eukprot:jgi/Mesen1/9868/ME000070S09155
MSPNTSGMSGEGIAKRVNTSSPVAKTVKSLFSFFGLPRIKAPYLQSDWNDQAFSDSAESAQKVPAPSPLKSYSATNPQITQSGSASQLPFPSSWGPGPLEAADFSPPLSNDTTIAPRTIPTSLTTLTTLTTPHRVADAPASFPAPVEALKQRLELTPKRRLSPARSSSRVSPAAAAAAAGDDIRPQADWTLQDLQQELVAISAQLPSTPIPRDSTPLPQKWRSPLSWRELSVTADFGREEEASSARRGASFAMRLSDSDSNSDSDSDSDSGSDESTDGKPRGADGASQANKGPDWRDQDHRRWQSSKGGKELREEGEEGGEGGDCKGKSGVQDSHERRRRAARVLEPRAELRQRRLAFESLLRHEQELERASLRQVALQEEEMRELQRRHDMQDQRAIAEAREEYLTQVLQEYTQRTQVGERMLQRDVTAAEDARRRDEAARREQELRAAKARAAAEERREAERKAAAAAAAAADRVAQEERQRAVAAAAAQEQRAARESAAATAAAAQAATPVASAGASPAAGAPRGPKAQIAEGAAREEAETMGRLEAARAVALPFEQNEAIRKERKVLERSIIKDVGQIAGTREQVTKKTRDILQKFGNSPHQVPTEFVALTLADKLLSQCESQVQKLPSFAFALAHVAVNVSLQVLLARLAQVCIYTIPKYLPYTKSNFASDDAYLTAVGYREDEGTFESTDTYVARVTGYITFFAAILQTKAPGGPNANGLARGWAWCARLLNKLPANRVTATALEAFIKVAGFRMYQEYPKPFIKLLQVVVQDFMENLVKDNDPDSRAVSNRLQTYILTEQFKRPPEGYELPQSDASSQLRA